MAALVRNKSHGKVKRFNILDVNDWNTSAYYWLMYNMTKHPMAPNSIDKFDRTVVVGNKWYALNIVHYERDIETQIKIVLGQKNYCKGECIFCCEKTAHSWKGNPWCFHSKCYKLCVRAFGISQAEKMNSMSTLHNILKKQLKIDGNEEYQLHLQFIQVRAMIINYDLVTNNKYTQKRELAGLNVGQKWYFEDSENHKSFTIDKYPDPTDRPQMSTINDAEIDIEKEHYYEDDHGHGKVCFFFCVFCLWLWLFFQFIQFLWLFFQHNRYQITTDRWLKEIIGVEKITQLQNYID